MKAITLLLLGFVPSLGIGVVLAQDDEDTTETETAVEAVDSPFSEDADPAPFPAAPAREPLVNPQGQAKIVLGPEVKSVLICNESGEWQLRIDHHPSGKPFVWQASQ